MTPKQRLQLLEVEAALSTHSFDNYRRVLNSLFQHYEHYDFVQRLSGLFRSKSYTDLVLFADSLSEQSYSDATTHFVANQFSLLIRKYPWSADQVKLDPLANCTRTFLRSERKCTLMNRKFFLYDNFRSPYEYQLSKVRAVIRYIIGNSPDIESILDESDFSAGASIGVHGNATHLSGKLLNKKWTCTPGASVYAYWAMMKNHHIRELLSECRDNLVCLDDEHAKSMFKSKVHLLSYNKISFVPKTAKTHRAIAVEPLLNGFVQKGADVSLRKMLKRIGIDLNDQSKNQELARLGSLEDSDTSFVTIDLKSASDSISIGLVKSILPSEWYEFLNSIRSKQYELGGKVFTYSKFCSMGNGFCFPLESLIFTACCVASGCGRPGTDFSVYGDDLVVRKQHASKLISLLKVCGFAVNVQKTFLQGPFRESCGADWFQGKDVRPYTLDHSLNTIESLFKFLNLTRRSRIATDFFAGVEKVVLTFIPEAFHFWRPFKGNPDSGIDSYGSEHMTSRNAFFDRRRRVWVVTELRHVPVPDRYANSTRNRHSSVDMYALLRGAPSRGYRVEYAFRRKTRTTIIRKDSVESTSTWVPPSNV